MFSETAEDCTHVSDGNAKNLIDNVDNGKLICPQINFPKDGLPLQRRSGFTPAWPARASDGQV